MSGGPEREVRVVIFHSPGDAWRQGVPFREQPDVEEHVRHYRQLLEDGRLALGGPFLDDSGGMMIAKAGVGLEELERFAAADPTVLSGLLRYQVRPWMIGMRAE